MGKKLFQVLFEISHFISVCISLNIHE